ncbi:peptidyl-prolyl cis-trans isomerase [Rubellimicrobium roseum]|uniref:Peptidylprolyl isomerase n=1 Tax=Rubellimicrobium roseum TaxID=687525 RepID=A0A5C4N4X2_9RHOB|nr:peptidyl-prolyl cis-trans isomerase [Rubellimicrobium roseum]TNC60525.1 peptidylprolyl isomerase [Rubellimicrobium roseum]
MAARKGKAWIYWLMVVGILLGFGGWFTGGAGGRTTAIGTVDGLDVAAQDYANALRNRMREVQEQTGQPLEFAQFQALGLDRAALAEVVSRRVLDAEVQRLELSVGDARVAEAVRSAPAFQGIDGEFDRDLYREQLSRNGLNEEAFETSLREDSARAILQAAVLGGMPEPTTYAEVLAAYSNETRAVTWATVTPEGVTVPEPSEEELRAHYEANPDAFTAPETRQVSYAWITPEMIQGEIAIDDAELRAVYDERRDEFVQEERRLVERLVFSSEEDAQAAQARIDSGEVDFEALVEERGLQLSDIDLGDVSLDELEEAGEPIFAAAAGDVVGPLPSSLGPALFRVNAVLAADEITFEEAAPDLRAEIASDRARDIIDDIRPQVEDLTAGGATITDLAERTDLEPGELTWSEDVTEGPAAYAEVREAVAAAQEGALPQIVELADGGLAVLQLDAVTPPALRPYEDVAAEVRASWEAEALRAAVLASAEAQAQAIAGGASFEEQGLTPAAEAALTRRGAVEGTPPGFVEAAFALEAGQARALATPDGAVVLRVDGITPARADDPAVLAEQTAIAEQVSSSLANDVFGAYATQLQANSEIRINDQAVQAVNNQMN